MSGPVGHEALNRLVSGIFNNKIADRQKHRHVDWQ